MNRYKYQVADAGNILHTTTADNATIAIEQINSIREQIGQPKLSVKIAFQNCAILSCNDWVYGLTWTILPEA